MKLFTQTKLDEEFKGVVFLLNLALTLKVQGKKCQPKSCDLVSHL